jgi:hypothetical protein
MPFFCAYYRILLADPNTFVLYAVDTQRNVVGLVAGCYNARVEAKLLRKKTASLLLPCIPRLLRQPSLVRSLYMRKSGLDGSTSGPWSFNEDPRISFWGWSPEASSEGQSTALLARYMELLKLRGFSRVRFEVDRVNRKAELVHRLMGATLVAKVDAFDGRERLIMEHVL